MTPASRSIYTFQFWLLCSSNFLFTSSFSMMIPELPGYLSSMGGRQYIGLIISLFTLTAGLSRPFSGKLTDTVGRVPVMAFGSLVCFVCGLLYPLLYGVGGLLLLRLLHGFSTGFKPTATSAYVADVVPAARRGEALSMVAVSASIGMSAGPSLGSWLTHSFGINTMFYTSAGFALLSILILLNLKETLPVRQRFHPSMLLLKRHEWFDTGVLRPFWAMLLVSYATGLLLTTGPDLCASVGIENKGLFFTMYTISSLGVRLVAGRASDRYGRLPVLLWSVGLQAVVMAALAFAHTPAAVLGLAFVFGIPWGLNAPTLQAWTVDRSVPANRGRALATVYIALEVGIGIGALASGYVHTRLHEPFLLNFLLAGAITAAAWVFLARLARRGRRPLIA